MERRKIFFGLITLSLVVTLFSNIGIKESKKLAAADKYKVIRVDGKIVFKKTEANMKKGDIFLSGTALSFRSPQSRAAVISSLKGRFVLSASEKGQTKILPAANNISSRSGALINMIDLKNHFSGNYLVLDKLHLEIGEERFPMNKDNFFYLSYEYNGEKIRKKVGYEAGNKLILDKSEIFKIDGEQIPTSKMDMTLYYRQGEESNKISSFSPVFPDLSELKDEIQIISDEFSNKTNAVKIQEITAYLDEFYGKPQKENLKGWLKTEFDLE